MFDSLFILLIATYFFHHFYWKRRNLPPGPTPWPILGNVPGIIAKAPGYDAFKEWSRQYGPVFTYWYGNSPIVTINDYEILAETVLADSNTYADRFLPSEILRLHRGGEWGIVDTSGAMWQEHRRFAMRTLRDFGMGKNVMEQKILAEVAPMIASMRAANGKPVEVIKYFDLTVGGIINSILLGRRFHKAPFFGEENMDEFRKLRSLLEEQSKLIYHHSFLMLMIAPSLRHFPYLKGAWQTMKTCSDNLFAFFRTQINLHESEIDFDTEQEPSDLAEAYLRERRRLQEQTGDEGFYSHKQLENVLYDLWIAGLETTTGSLAWLMAYILHQPEIQDKMRAEIKSVLRPGEEVVTTEHRTMLPYCAAVIMETQRLANLIPLNFQRVTNKDTTIHGFFIPAGTAIMPQISSVMYNEKIFPDPYAFDPERFIDDDGKLKNIDQWMPFSIGARRCPGESLAKMELYLILTNLILNFEILPDDSNRIPTMTRTGTTVQKPEDHKLRLRPLN